MKLTGKKIIILAVIVTPLLLAFLFVALFCAFITVPTGAMQNTIQPGGHLIINKLARDIQRGDIAMFTYPRNHSFRYLMRVIGLPGETIEFRGQKVFINGK